MWHLFIVRALGHWLVTIINLRNQRDNCSFPLHFPRIFSAFKSWNMSTVFRFWDFQHTTEELNLTKTSNCKCFTPDRSILQDEQAQREFSWIIYFLWLPNNNYEVQKTYQSVPAKCSSTHCIWIKKTLVKSTAKLTWIVSRQNERKLQLNWSFENFLSFL